MLDSAEPKPATDTEVDAKVAAKRPEAAAAKRKRGNFPVQINPESYACLSAASLVTRLSRMQILDFLISRIGQHELCALLTAANITARRAGRSKKSFHAHLP